MPTVKFPLAASSDLFAAATDTSPMAALLDIANDPASSPEARAYAFAECHDLVGRQRVADRVFAAFKAAIAGEGLAVAS
jgi:hypothetical protein